MKTIAAILLVLSGQVQAEEEPTPAEAQKALSAGVCIENRQIKLLNRRYKYDRKIAVRLGYLKSIRGRMALEDQTSGRTIDLTTRREELAKFRAELKKLGLTALKCTGDENPEDPPEYLLRFAAMEGMDDGMIHNYDDNGDEVNSPLP